MTNPDVNLPISKESSTTQTQSEDQLITIKNLNRRSLVGLLDTAALLQSLADYLRRNGKAADIKRVKSRQHQICQKRRNSQEVHL